MVSIRHTVIVAVAVAAGLVASAGARASSEGIAAIYAAQAGDWAEARRIAADTRDPVASDLVAWLDYSREETLASFVEITGFLVDNPDWPQQKTLRQRAEQALTGGEDDAVVLAWFERNPPLTLPGAERFARALQARGEAERATAVVRAAWIAADAKTVEDEDRFYLAFVDVLTREDSAQRLDRLLWAGRTQPAQRLLPRVDDATRAAADARLALRQQRDDAARLAALVPAEARGDAGFVFEQARWYRRRGDDASARALLTASPVDGVQPELFWQERQPLARKALANGDASAAYAVASSHGFAPGSEYIDTEWLAGWIAYRFLGDAERGQRHFLGMFDAARHPGSRARGGYWLARSAADLGDGDAAVLWHRTAAQHAVTFYGQLSAAEIRPAQPLRMPAEPRPTAAETRQFDTHELTRALRLLAAAGYAEPQRAVAIRLAELGESGGWKNLAAGLAHEIDRPDLAVAIGRQSIRGGTPLVPNAYPLLSLPDLSASLPQPVEPALVHAVIRQESSFDRRAVSSAGARGLMQLMPGTAKSVAAGLGLAYDPAGLTADPSYNISLGKSYLGAMLDRYGGSYVLALAAYNAGPGRVNEWLRSIGDPRGGGTAAVDWIEMIPFTETRGYVQRCMENLHVYRTLTGELRLAQSLGDDLLR